MDDAFTLFERHGRGIHALRLHGEFVPPVTVACRERRNTTRRGAAARRAGIRRGLVGGEQHSRSPVGSTRPLRGAAAVAGIGATPYYKRGTSPHSALRLTLEAILAARADAGGGHRPGRACHRVPRAH
ncbi:MAG TPA: hypothetical protein VMK84_05965 [Streptosporangiaceae bacterium]|nr:hypothetical protein [Streptosporangiaceae bacterium]